MNIMPLEAICSLFFSPISKSWTWKLAGTTLVPFNVGCGYY
jgi:hypothetical protein